MKRFYICEIESCCSSDTSIPWTIHIKCTDKSELRKNEIYSAIQKSSPYKPTGVFHRFIGRLRFLLERFLLRKLSHRLLLAAIIVVVVVIIAGELDVILAPEISETGEGVWWPFLRLTDPVCLGDDQGCAQRFISTMVKVLGCVLFLGLLIAILTQWLNQFIAPMAPKIWQASKQTIRRNRALIPTKQSTGRTFLRASTSTNLIRTP